jgi:catechol 2,3-dioxygenase-like lactoylglutathione lyase family enzyme
MPSFKFNHIALAVKDVKESVDFYQKVFEFEEIPNTASNSKTRWLSMEDGLQLHLIPRPEAEIKIVKAVHFAITTDDLEGFIRHLGALGISFSDWQDQPNEIYVRQDGIRQIYFQDPNGYWVEVNDDL